MIDREFIDRIVELARPPLVTVGGRTYSPLELNEVCEPTASTFTIHTLSGLCDYIKEGVEEEGLSIFLHVVNHAMVLAMSPLFGEFRQREYYVKAELPEMKSFPFGQYLGLEEFNVALQSLFVQDANTINILRLISNLKDGAVTTFDDDGISQTVKAKVGIAKIEDVQVPNPVTLRPYRTFLDVDEQPESKFIFRMRSGAGEKMPTCALFEADGGRWKLDAIAKIAAYLRENTEGIVVLA